MKVGIAENSRIGGTCVMRGCVPKKLLVYGAQFADAFEDARGFGWDVTPPRFDWPTLIANKNKELDRLEGIYRSLLKDCTLFEARATLDRCAHHRAVERQARHRRDASSSPPARIR